MDMKDNGQASKIKNLILIGETEDKAALQERAKLHGIKLYDFDFVLKTGAEN